MRTAAASKDMVSSTIKKIIRIPTPVNLGHIATLYHSFLRSVMGDMTVISKKRSHKAAMKQQAITSEKMDGNNDNNNNNNNNNSDNNSSGNDNNNINNGNDNNS